MQYAIPQFVEIEDKVIGPLTVKQFAYLLGGGLFVAAMSAIVETGPLIAIAVLVGAIVVPLAFVKINGRPLPQTLAALLQFNLRPKKRLWAKDVATKTIAIQDLVHREEPQQEGPRVKSLDRSRISDLALQLDTAGTAAYAETEPDAIEF
ncbi:MAG: PrgI family protein [Candidatus Doudnabacteria bacterium]|nr:PrgI family protein [Candidatus Doudnabacteria bacterium]